MTTACPPAPREKKTKQKQNKTKKKQQQQTDPHGEDKKKKQHKLGMNTVYEMYIFRFETQRFLEQNTPLRIVKLLKFKIEADELFFFF